MKDIMSGMTGINNVNNCRERREIINYRTDQIFNKRDTNGNNRLSPEETRLPEESFNKIDLNDDGQVGKMELNTSSLAYLSKKITDGILERRDTNGDNRLSPEETRLPEESFNKIDLNDDGQVGKMEMLVSHRLDKLHDIYLNHHHESDNTLSENVNISA